MNKALFLTAKFFFNASIFHILIPLIKLLHSITPKKRSNRALVISIFYIGDTLYSTPAIKLLKKNRPEIKIDLLINKNSFPIFEHNPDINHLFIDNSKITLANTPLTLFKKIKANFKNIVGMFKNNYDYVFDVSGGFEAAIFTILAGRKEKYGILKESLFKSAYDNYIFDPKGLLHLKKMPCEVVRKANLFSDDNNYDYSLVIPSNTTTKIDNSLTRFHLKKGLVILAPFAGWYTKEWPLESFLELAQRLVNQGYFIGFIGAANDQSHLDKYNCNYGSSIHSFAGKTSLLESAALIKRASLFIGCDSSQAIIAEALKVPLIKIFGSTDPEHAAPENNNLSRAVYKKLKCSPNNSYYCSKSPLLFTCPNDLECMKKITVDNVFTISMELLSNYEQLINKESEHVTD
jgi:ADP-heptose:LPS heptosyltransferase